MVGISLALVGISTAVVQTLIIKPVVKTLGERRAMFVGLVFFAAGLITLGIASTTGWFWVGTLVLALGGFYGPSIQALMSTRVDLSEQGRLQGALGSLRGIAMLVGPGLFTQVLAAGINRKLGWNLPGAPWFLAGAFVLSALAIATIVTRNYVRPARSAETLTLPPTLAIDEVEAP